MKARHSKKPLAPKPRPKPVTITRRFLEALTGTKEDSYYRVLDAIALGRRDKVSMTKAARSRGTTVKTVLKYGGSAIEVRGGRYHVKPSDRLPRRMRMLTSQGEVPVRTTSSRTATRIADYNNAMRAYVLTGDLSELKRFAGKTVRSGGTVYEFATDRRTVDRYVRAGGVHFVDIYARGVRG
jgi:hypothetical protein